MNAVYVRIIIIPFLFPILELKQVNTIVYEEMGIEKYVFVATLDNRTSLICQEMDNQVFNCKDRDDGYNYPPLHPNCRSATRPYLDEEAEKLLQRRATNPITGETEVINNMSYKEWLKQHNIVDTKNGMFRTSNNVVYNSKSFGKLDSELVETNVNQLDNLLNKYPKVANFVKDKGLKFGGKEIEAIAVTSHSYDMKRLGMHLSNKYYKNKNTYLKAINNNVTNGNFMPCSDKNLTTYALNHEFGHLVENYLINEYNINNPTEFSNFETRLRNAINPYQFKKIFNDYENNISDKMRQDITDISFKNNKGFILNDNLSGYGKVSSKEFFAECFANMESGNPNELGKAMKEYLKGVM